MSRRTSTSGTGRAAIVGLGWVGPTGFGREGLESLTDAEHDAHGLARAPSLRRGVEWPHDDPKRLRSYDPLVRIGVLATMQAAGDAGWERADLAGDDLAFTLGTELGSDLTNEAYFHGVLGRAPLSPRLFTYTLPSCILGELSIHYEQTGIQETLCAGATSGAQALAAAAGHIEAGRAKRALAVSADLVSELVAAALAIGAGGAPRPRRVVEGACALALWEAEEARAANARVLAEIVGHADGFGPDAAQRCAEVALAAAGVGRDELDLTLHAGPEGGTGLDALGATGPVALARALHSDGPSWRIALVISLCYSGAASALVVRRPHRES